MSDTKQAMRLFHITYSGLSKQDIDGSVLTFSKKVAGNFQIVAGDGYRAVELSLIYLKKYKPAIKLEQIGINGFDGEPVDMANIKSELVIGY